MVRLSLKTSDSASLGLTTSGDVFLDLRAGIEIVDNRLPDYLGVTDVTPTASIQTLPTRETSVLSDITVRAVPYEETTNDAGGYTVSILS